MTNATLTNAPLATSGTLIDTGIQQRVQQIIAEQNATIKQREDVIHGLWVARVANQHLLLLGPGGTGKSMLVRDAVSHIDDAVHFETALDETTDPGQVFGPPDIPAMVKEGKNRRVVTGMLPEATDAFVDEIFNGNSPVLHSLMPIMNERIFHNNGMPSDVPLRSLYAGTNKLNADSDLAAFFDRLHIRFAVDYVKSRNDQADMIGDAIGRMAMHGRGTATSIAATKTMVTLAELDQAHTESLNLNVDQAVMDMFLDLAAELRAEGVHISDRRKVEGMAAVLANAWIRGHEDVKAIDLDILASMWWIVQDQVDTVQKIVLAAANPGERAAVELLEEFRKLDKEYREASREDETRRRRVSVEIIRNIDKLIAEGEEHKAKAAAAGSTVSKLDTVTDKATQLKVKIGEEVFGLTPADATALSKS